MSLDRLEPLAVEPLPGVDVRIAGASMELRCGDERVAVSFDSLDRIAELTAE